MAKSVRYKDGSLIMEGTETWELYHNPPKVRTDGNTKQKTLEGHMKELDDKWRKMEGRKPVSQLTEREKMLEGRIPWDRLRLEELSACTCYLCKRLFAEEQVDEFLPFQIFSMDADPAVWVCTKCAETDEHKRNVDTSDTNWRAEESYQEWCAEQGANEED